MQKNAYVILLSLMIPYLQFAASFPISDKSKAAYIEILKKTQEAVQKNQSAKENVEKILVAPAGGALGGAIGGAIGGLAGAAAGPAIAVVSIAVGIKLLVPWAKKQIEKRKKSGGKKDDKEDDDEDEDDQKDPKDPKGPKKPDLNGNLGLKHPERKYEKSPKHHQNSKGNIGKEPKNPQASLDKAVDVYNTNGKLKKSKIGIEDGHYVEFKPHAPGKYHGYIIEHWADVKPAQRNALYKNGLVTDITSGRIA